MHQWIVKFILALLLILGTLMFEINPGLAARFQVYFVAIGSSIYASPGTVDQHGLGDIYGANNGAKAFARHLMNGGAVFGLTLTSDEGHLVTVADVTSAITRVKAAIAST